MSFKQFLRWCARTHGTGGFLFIFNTLGIGLALLGENLGAEVRAPLYVKASPSPLPVVSPVVVPPKPQDPLQVKAKLKQTSHTLISGLKWTTPFLDLTTIDSATGRKIKVVLKGGLARKDLKLLYKEAAKVILNAADFSIEIILTGVVTPVTLVGIDAYGKSETTEVRVELPEFEAIKLGLKPKAPSRLGFNTGASYSLITYTEIRPKFPDTAVNLAQSALTFKQAIYYQVLPPWLDVGGTLFITAVPLSYTTAASARFLGINARIGVVVPYIEKPWRLGIMTGFYYSSVLVKNNAFGYSNISGPQIFPTLRRSFKNNHSVTAYFKFSPISDGFSFLTFDNREVASGISYTIPIFGTRSLSLSLDWSDLYIGFGESEGLDAMNIHTKTLNFGLGFGF